MARCCLDSQGGYVTFSMRDNPVINQAPDATAFLGICALLVGVLVTIVGTSMAQLIIGNPEVAEEVVGRRKRMLISVALLVIVDLWGVFFPLTTLALNTLGSISRGVVVGVLISTGLVILVNLIWPLYFTMMAEIYQIGRSAIATKWEEISGELVKRGYLTENDVMIVDSSELYKGPYYEDDEFRSKVQDAVAKFLLLDQPHGRHPIGKLLYKSESMMVRSAADNVVVSTLKRRWHEQWLAEAKARSSTEPTSPDPEPPHIGNQ